MDDIKKDPYEKAVSLLEPQWRQVLERVPEEVWPTISEIRFRLFQPSQYGRINAHEIISFHSDSTFLRNPGEGSDRSI